MLLGAHMSIEGGLENAIERGESIGCTAIQIFAKNNNRWSAPPYREDDVREFKKRWKQSSIRVVFSHDAYLINLASPRREIYQKSMVAMRDELDRAEALGLPFVVMHPGSGLGEPVSKAIAQLAQALSILLKQTGGYRVKIAIENMAGQGNSIGHRFEQIAEVIDRAKDSDRLGVCLDTCHTLAAGYDIRTKPGFDTVMREFHKKIGLEKLFAFHLNDSKKPYGSRVDRHEHIGKGYLGLMPFRLIMNDRRFTKIPKVLETPKGPDLAEDVMNLTTLRDLVAH